MFPVRIRLIAIAVAVVQLGNVHALSGQASLMRPLSSVSFFGGIGTRVGLSWRPISRTKLVGVIHNGCGD